MAPEAIPDIISGIRTACSRSSIGMATYKCRYTSSFIYLLQIGREGARGARGARGAHFTR